MCFWARAVTTWLRRRTARRSAWSPRRPRTFRRVLRSGSICQRNGAARSADDGQFFWNGTDTGLTRRIAMQKPTWSRRDVLKASSAVAAAGALVTPAKVLAAAPPATAITPQLIEAAKKEGKV